MIGEMYSGYLYMAIAIWIFSGLFNLGVDRTNYGQFEMKKEQKASTVLGWINLSLGILTFTGAMIIKLLV
ncbi:MULTISPECIES: CLC_0170 family protein [Paenibacillus]|uniref:DUF350 domain-containing protein n=1 Tax=Paenibacillus campinasensis TaxID=66347 RepID=A0ABW9T270_9BACL|nr:MULTISPECIES: CLC_0170 family protein [Paenibacillus]MUG66807.1 hypothetical protein [Paenibacillus campinasensis]PAK55824.1 hypothetical protein CHH75_00710 [Paenibacillus sp. 7541]